MTALLRTALFDWHASHGGRMVEFGGWEMPVQYAGIVEEHQAVRQAVGLFDISHMGRLIFSGTDARRFVDRLVTCRVDNLATGQIRYGLVCREDGGILDDILVYGLEHDAICLVVNASNRPKILDWLAQQPPLPDCQLTDQTTTTSMFALQGPQALSLLQPFTHTPLAAMKYYSGQPVEIDGVEVYLSRTGYTGEDGFEIIASDTPVEMWERLVAAGAKPCGLGARDTLRLEAAMPLYGHELNETIDPLTAGLAFAVKFEKPDFIGKAALQQIAQKPERPIRIGVQLTGRRIAREGASVLKDGHTVGHITSGTFSPTLQAAIGMAYVDSTLTVGTAVEVDIRGKQEPATLVPLPFYRRPNST